MCIVNKYCAWLVLVSMDLGLDYAVNFAGISVAIKVWVGWVRMAMTVNVVCVEESNGCAVFG